MAGAGAPGRSVEGNRLNGVNSSGLRIARAVHKIARHVHGADMASKQDTDSFWRRNGLSLVFGALMVVTLVGHALSGLRVENSELEHEGKPPLDMPAYLASAPFQSSLFENWESEFLQMGLFVLLTGSLRQKGSSESRKMDPAEEEHKKYPAAVQPWLARVGGLWRKIYEHSLSLALFLLFALSFVGHWIGSWRQQRDEALHHGELPQTLWQHLVSAQLWFESMQNWQSEFLAVVAIVVLSIYLREQHSSQSKQVEAPHSETGA
jgi:hypothetical protein